MHKGTLLHASTWMKWFGCHADHQEDNRGHQKWIWEIRCAQAAKYANEGIHPGFETQGRYHQMSKTGASVAPQKGLISSKNFIRKRTLFEFSSEVPEYLKQTTK